MSWIVRWWSYWVLISGILFFDSTDGHVGAVMSILEAMLSLVSASDFTFLG